MNGVISWIIKVLRARKEARNAENRRLFREDVLDVLRTSGEVSYYDLRGRLKEKGWTKWADLPASRYTQIKEAEFNNELTNMTDEHLINERKINTYITGLSIHLPVEWYSLNNDK